MDNPQPTDKGLAKDLKKYSDTKYDNLIQQIDAEYNLSWLNQYERIQQNLLRLKLYNNQKKDLDLVGDSLLFTVHQTVLASLYDDELAVRFDGREQGDSNRASNLGDLAAFDYQLMNKNVNDYMWDWDALFFSRGLNLMMEFDRSKEFMCPISEILDPMTFLHDPKATSVNGDMRRRGGMRFGGYELWLKRDSLKSEYGFFDTSYLRSSNEMKSLLKKAEDERNNAQNLQNVFNKDVSTNLYDNGVIAGLKWFTFWKGKYVMAVLTNDRKRIIKYFELPFQDKWPIIERLFNPSSHSWDGVSIPDLVEDKQRQRSVTINLSMKAMKYDLYPKYLYDEDRIKNKGDLLNTEFNSFVGIQNNDGKDIAGAVRPMNKADIRMDMVNFILNTLEGSAEKSTASPAIMQGAQSAKDRPLGETNLMAQNAGTRYSLTAKVFGWSEKEYWRTHYRLYKEYFAKDIDEKIIRISGALGSAWKPFKRDDIITDIDPDITVESVVISEQKKTRQRILMQGFGNALVLEPTANRRFFLKQLGKLNNLRPDELELMIPPTSEELKARDENVIINQNKLVQVKPTDDHMAHLEQHASADETSSKAAHIAAHKMAMEIQRTQPDLFSPPQLDAKGNPVMSDPNNPGGVNVLARQSIPQVGANLPKSVSPVSAVTDLVKPPVHANG